jgi:hypothetical protein
VPQDVRERSRPRLQPLQLALRPCNDRESLPSRSARFLLL